MAKSTVELNTIRVGEETIVTIGKSCLVIDRNGEVAGACRGDEKYCQYPVEGWEVVPNGDLKEVFIKFLLAEAAEIATGLMRSDDEDEAAQG